QLPDLVEVSGQYRPGAAVDDPRPTRAQVSSYEASINVPIPLGPKTFLIPGVSYHVDSVSFDDAPPGFVDLRAFHSIEIPVMLLQLLPDDWSLTLRVAPGVAGDMQALDTRMLRASALVLATRSFSPRLVAGAGGLASYTFGTFLPLPAAYVDWK